MTEKLHPRERDWRRINLIAVCAAWVVGIAVFVAVSIALMAVPAQAMTPVLIAAGIAAAITAALVFRYSDYKTPAAVVFLFGILIAGQGYFRPWYRDQYGDSEYFGTGFFGLVALSAGVAAGWKTYKLIMERHGFCIKG